MLPWYTIVHDHVTGLLVSDRGNDQLWIVVDRATRYCHLIPMRKTDTAKDLARVFMREIVRIHGLPYVVQNDRGPLFTSSFWKEVMRLAGVTIDFTTPDSAHTSGLAEKYASTVRM